MLDQGVWAEVRVGNEHLRLFAEHNAQGVQASVYNVASKTWIAPSEPAEDLEQGKEGAEGHARGIPQTRGECGIASPSAEGITFGLASISVACVVWAPRVRRL